MPSLRTALLDFYLRSTLKPKPLHQIDPVELRAWFAKRALRLIPKGVVLESVDTETIHGEWHRPAGGASRTILYLHGGAYVFGAPRAYRSLTYALALAARADIFAPVYRLAPEHPCPAAIEDACAAYRWLLSGGVAPERLIVAGDSAGGGLALSTLMALRDAGAPMPAGAFLYSPWTDLACTGDSIRSNDDSDAMFKSETIRAGAARYQGALDAKDPRVSPLYGDFVGLPPILAFASRSELLFDDAARLAPLAKAARVPFRLEAREGLPHIWPLFQALTPEGEEAVALSAQFVVEQTGG